MKFRQGKFRCRYSRIVIKQLNFRSGIVGEALAVCADARRRAKSHLPVPVNSRTELLAAMIASHYELTFQVLDPVLTGKFRARFAASSAL
jgi:hypothetical protein